MMKLKWPPDHHPSSVQRRSPQVYLIYESNPNPSAEQMTELAEKLKLTTRQLQLWFRKGRLDYVKKMEALALELGSLLLQRIVTPELQRRIEQDKVLRLLQDKNEVLEQENEQGRGSSNISGLSKEQLDLLLETFKSSPHPSTEQMRELAEKLKLTTGQVQLWFRKERLDLPKKMEALNLELGCLFLGIVAPELQQRRIEQDKELQQRRIEQDEELKRMQDENKVMEQELEQLTKGRIKRALELDNLIKLQQDTAKAIEQEKEQLAKWMAWRRCSEGDNMVGAVQLGADCGTAIWPGEGARRGTTWLEQCS